MTPDVPQQKCIILRIERYRTKSLLPGRRSSLGTSPSREPFDFLTRLIVLTLTWSPRFAHNTRSRRLCISTHCGRTRKAVCPKNTFPCGLILSLALLQVRGIWRGWIRRGTWRRCRWRRPFEYPQRWLKSCGRRQRIACRRRRHNSRHRRWHFSISTQR